MIKHIKRNITTVECGVILQGVNTRGAMGSGVALAIMQKWPYVYESYKAHGIGNHLLGSTEFILNSDHIGLVIVNGYTQTNYGNDGKRYADINAVEKCVAGAVEYAEAFDLPVYMPKIGCGLGGLSWETEVEPVIRKVSLDFPTVNIFICDL